MAKVDADIEVKRFGYDSDSNGRRLVFPNAHTHKLEGRAGQTTYGASDCTFENLQGRLDTLRWTADAASIGAAWLRDDGGRFDLAVERTEFPKGVRIVRAADAGVELLAPHVTFSELRLNVKGPFAAPKPPSALDDARRGPPTPAPAPAPASPTQRQEKLRFLDSLSGRIYMTLKIVLDLPVIGKRTLDQALRIPIQEGSLDFRALENSLDWLEGTFLDIKHADQRLKVQWKVPIFGSGHDLITWGLDTDASMLASFGRVPVRSFTDFRIGSEREKPPTESEVSRKRGVLKAFSLDKIDIALSLLAPRHLTVGAGTIMFGGDEAPGMVDLKVSGDIHDQGAGMLKGAIGSVDTTIKDLKLGPSVLSADRLHFDGVEQLEVTFDGFRPMSLAIVVHRVTATNIALKLGEYRPQIQARSQTEPSAASSSQALPIDRTQPR